MVQKESAVTPQRFGQGKAWTEYVASIQKNADKFVANYEATEISVDDAAALKALAAKPNGPARVLALAEDWCPDVYRGLGQIAKVAEALGVELRIFERDSHLDIMDEFLNKGQFQSIPVAVFYTADMRKIASWHERSQLANDEHSLVDEIFVEGKPREQQRAEYAAFQSGPAWARWRQDAVREMRELLETNVA